MLAEENALQNGGIVTEEMRLSFAFIDCCL